MPRKPKPKAPPTSPAKLETLLVRLPHDDRAWLVDLSARVGLDVSVVARIAVADLRRSGWSPAAAMHRQLGGK